MTQLKRLWKQALEQGTIVKKEGKWVALGRLEKEILKQMRKSGENGY